tara:strand:- start:3079 stop:3609 length:531 start_codon:yes stop_codon:yes gene_type:complete
MKILLSNNKAIGTILFLSALILLFLFWLIYFRDTQNLQNSLNLDFLPTLNALLNFLSATCLSLGFIAIKKGNQSLHKKMMLSALIFSAVFLVSYLIYHSFHGDTPYLEVGLKRYVYFFILISHVALSVIVLPLIMTTVFFAIKKQFYNHSKIAQITFPIWLYVSITGVLVYLMLHF